ncbi:UDP-glucose 4-epimerase GalE [Glutamicibacter halophytocola]|uniref:UDP-glucose 4-epimerase n=1 Tax=Glutamicibacter halophytocola TaxID=1933880 RepID=A0AA94Y181_9MICC|nr:UDP-glucose 4-epimerase GalE [Glutamicibacter halophytocola]UUX60398.1 UDP-glucose 4-epimerase GalE [Glutamicibacter halophytocola]
MHVLVTGGAGYIGSHAVLLLLEAGHKVSVFDNLSNSSPESLRRVRDMSNSAPELFIGDLLDSDRLDAVLSQTKPDAVIHFGGLKAVGESVEKPISYYQNNVVGTLNLVSAMEKAGVKRLVFSSSATVYAESTQLPLVEDAQRAASNPYGRTKLHIEQILEDLAVSDSSWSIATLRYFNPVGAHPSGNIGEDPQGIPNNLMPFIAQVAVGRRSEVQVFGNDYPTYDGTGVRDYIHVMDLAQGHLDALDFLNTRTGQYVWNLGTGSGTSVLDVIGAFSRACGRQLPYKLVERRPGDIAEYYGDPTTARLELGWKAERGVEEMARDMWEWQSKNPAGYPDYDLDGISEEEINEFIRGSRATIAKQD